jgi:hypothetical protein
MNCSTSDLQKSCRLRFGNLKASQNHREMNSSTFGLALSILWVRYPLSLAFDLSDCPNAGRLLYTTGNITEAVRTFLGALRVLEYPTLQPVHEVDGEYLAPLSQDKSFLDDFRVAFAVRTILFSSQILG